MGLPKDNMNGYKNGSVLEFVDRFPSEYVFIYRRDVAIVKEMTIVIIYILYSAKSIQFTALHN